MELALEVVELLGGCQLWGPIIFIIFSFPFLICKAFQVGEDAFHTGKKGYVAFKRVIWHKSFHELLTTIRQLSKLGYNIECADGIVRHIFPAILILSADYEEQYDSFHLLQLDLTFTLGVLWLSLEAQTANSPALYVLCQRRKCARVYHILFVPLRP
jgi:hypothetical protein